MSPHVNGYSPSSTDTSSPTGNGSVLGVRGLNGFHYTNGNGGHEKWNKSHLRSTNLDDIFDLICIGFGPANLAIAVALHDALDSNPSPPGLESLCNGRSPKVLFLERQSHFMWHEGMLLPGAKMQISFIKDLATLRDPRSSFTFLNYLHQQDRLVPFANLSTFLPERIEYQDYMKWCAGWFDNVVRYGQEVTLVTPVQAKRVPGSAPVSTFQINTKDVSSGSVSSMRARHVVIGVGGKPNMPAPLPAHNPKIIHSSQYNKSIGHVLRDTSRPYNIAILGAGQSAAEVFDNLHSRYPNAHTSMIMKGDAMRPSDDSPFVNEIFDPSRITPFYAQPPEYRQTSLRADRPTNYSVVRTELLEHIYAKLYMQRLKCGNDESAWQHRILNRRTVVKAEPIDHETGAERVRLTLEHSSASNIAAIEERTFDAVVCAAGYVRDAHEDLLAGCRHLLPRPSHPASQAAGAKPHFEVRRDYSVKFADGAVAGDGRAGVWLQGCNESTHGLSDSLLSILATRAGEMVRNLFGDR